MSANKWAAEEGGILLTLTFVLAFLALIGGALTTMILASRETSYQNVQSRRAYFIAQSGIEYGVKRFLLSDPTRDRQWREQLSIQFATDCQVEARVVNDSTCVIEVLARPQGAFLRMESTILFEDLAQYAVITNAAVDSLASVPAGLVWQAGNRMPIFDYQELLTSATRSGHYTGDLQAQSSFSFPFNRQALVEKNLDIYGPINSSGSFYVRGSTRFLPASNQTPQSQGLANLANAIDVTAPSDGSTAAISGGIIAFGGITGDSLIVYHDSSLMSEMLSQSVNGSSLSIKRIQTRIMADH